MAEQTGAWLACPCCSGPLDVSSSGLRCPAHGEFPISASGLGDLRPEAIRGEADAFAATYREARLSEGWQPLSPEIASALPYANPAGFNRLYWPLRRESWAAFERLLLTIGPPPLTIADAGAGFAWASHRLATLGQRVLAFDLSADPDFGLGAARLYPTAITAASPSDLLHPSAAGRFSPLLGSLEQPPLAAASFDVIVCNASLHYVNSLEVCLATLARALRPAGMLAVLDSPVAPRGWRPEARPGGATCGVRVFSKDELDTALRAAGLTPTWVRVRRGALWARHRLAARLHRHPAFDFPLVAARKSSLTP